FTWWTDWAEEFPDGYPVAEWMRPHVTEWFREPVPPSGWWLQSVVVWTLLPWSCVCAIVVTLFQLKVAAHEPRRLGRWVLSISLLCLVAWIYLDDLPDFRDLQVRP
ncbi:MAG: hypothetical protein AAF517_28260, partial [Planctomycetota bacterium]